MPELSSFGGHDREVHNATPRLWQDLEGARSFADQGLRRDALRARDDWFLEGSWSGYVLWGVADGVTRYRTLAQGGASADQFTFSSKHGAA